MPASNIFKKLNCRDTRIFPNINNTLTKIIFVFLIVVTVIFFAKNILAENTLQEKQAAIQKGNNQEAWLDGAMGSNLVSINMLLVGEIPDNILIGETNPDGTPKLTSFVPGGALATTTKMISALYNPPASGIQYIAQIKDNFLGKSSYAQGVGFESLQPILPLWKTFRNIVYGLISIIFIAIGIMIMLRVKVSPQAVITIQSAIPQLITTLILVTFSYAIAGLVIDLMNFIQALILSALFNGTGTSFDQNLFPSGIFNQIGNFFRRLFGGTDYNPNSFQPLMQVGFWKTWSLINLALPQLTITILSLVLGAIIGAIFSAGIGAPAGAVLALLIVNIVIFWLVIKFFVGLIKCYFSVVLKIITGPLEIGLGAIPNSKIGFKDWFLNLIGNIAVFPLSILFLVLLNLIVQAVQTGNLWTPNIIGGVSGLTGGLIGLGGLFMLPKLPELIPEFIFKIKPSPFGKAIGEGFNSASRTTSGLVGGYFGVKKGALEKAESSYQEKQKKYENAPGSPAPSFKQKTQHKSYQVVDSLTRKK